MTDSNLDMDAFPCILENPSDFRKGSGDYGVTLAVQVKHVDQIQPLMAKAQKPFAAFLVPMGTIEQAEGFIKAQDSKSGLTEMIPDVDVQSAIREDLSPPFSLPLKGMGRGGDAFVSPQSAIATLEEVSLALSVDPRTVQNYADAGLLVRNARGQYDLLASLAAMNKARKDAETAQGDALRDEKFQSVRINRQRREVELQEKLGTLVNRDSVRRAFEKVLALVRQRFVMMPKYMAPRLDGLPAKEQEPLLEDYARESLAALSAPDLGGPDENQHEPRSHGVTEKSEKPVSRKGRKGRKGGAR